MVWVWDVRGRGVKDNTKVFCPSNWKNEAAIYLCLARLKERCSILDMINSKCLLDIQVEMLGKQLDNQGGSSGKRFRLGVQTGESSDIDGL